MHDTPADRHHHPFLDALRFAAALLVSLGHIRALWFTPLRDLGETSIPVKLFYLATGVQYEAVVVFFVLSGYLVGGTAWRRIEDGTFRPADYLIDRFSRIYIVLIPAIVLAAILAFAGVALFPESAIYAGPIVEPSEFSPHWTLGQIPCHLISVQGVFCEAFSFNPPLWSLGHEWLYYMLAPLVLLALYRPRGVALKAAAVAVPVILMAILIPDPLFWVEWPLFWLLGMLAARMAERRPMHAIVGFLGLGATAAAFLAAQIADIPSIAKNLMVALPLAVAFTAPAVTRLEIFPGLSRWGADFSYSLYALHVPVTMFIAAAAGAAGGPVGLGPPGLARYAAFAASLLILLIAARGFAAITEDRTGALRRTIRQRLAPAPA